MADPTTLISRMQKYAESFGNFDRDIIMRWADEVALLSRQYEEMRKALEKAFIHLAVSSFWRDRDMAIAIEKILSSAPSPSETEKSG